MDYERYLKRYHQDLENITTQMMDFKNKENVIKRNTDTLKKTQNDLKNNETLMGRVKTELGKLDIANNVLSYYEILDSIEQNEEQIKVQKEKRTNLKQKGIGGGTPKFKQQVSDFNKGLSQF